jgi:hypothetical protein
MKPKIPSVTLICVDTTAKPKLARRAMEKTQEQMSFGSAKFLGQETIPTIASLDEYSAFCIRELHKHFDTSHCLIVQSDGYVLNGSAWDDEFLKYDYIGAPWLPANIVGNGGFSLRSHRLCRALSEFTDNPHPEDSFICVRHRREIEEQGFKFAPLELARKFAFEGRSWNQGAEWSGVPVSWDGQFGFHSWLTPLPAGVDRPRVFHHTGDFGDVIYSLPVIRALGGGVLFLSDDNRFPFPRKSRQRVNADWVNSISPLLEQQDCIWRASYTHALPFSTDCDLNKFREPWSSPASSPTQSIFSMHLKAFNVDWPEDRPWLTVDHPDAVPPVIVNLTPRYRNHHFPWLPLIKRHGDQMGFVGTHLEYLRFSDLAYGVGKNIPWIKTANLLEAARAIAGAKVFIGNQSAPMAIALGLGKNVIQECWQGNPNCLLRRDNAIYWGVTSVDPQLQIPEGWLA